MSPAKVWFPIDTLVVVLTFILPILTGTFALSTYDELHWGNVSAIELDWTFWAVVGVLVSIYKTYLLGGDQWALSGIAHNPRLWLTGLWTVANVVGMGFAFLSYDVVGVLAMQFPSNPVARIEGIPPQFISGGAFMLGEDVLLTVLVFGLICRKRLAQ